MAGSYSLGEHFETFVREQVAAGLYNNESEVVRDALRQLEERQLKLKALREHVKNAIKRGGNYTDDDIAAILAELPGTMGRARSELMEGLRSIPHGNYVILFRYNGAVLEIVSIIEGHRDIEGLFH
jgi:antitoxin ParD1/3/4